MKNGTEKGVHRRRRGPRGVRGRKASQASNTPVAFWPKVEAVEAVEALAEAPETPAASVAHPPARTHARSWRGQFAWGEEGDVKMDAAALKRRVRALNGMGVRELQREAESVQEQTVRLSAQHRRVILQASELEDEDSVLRQYIDNLMEKTQAPPTRRPALSFIASDTGSARSLR